MAFKSISAILIPFHSWASNAVTSFIDLSLPSPPKAIGAGKENMCNYQNIIKKFCKYQGLNFDELVRSRLPLAGGNTEFRQGIEKIRFSFSVSEENGLSPYTTYLQTL
jgi:hypothetical protein